MRKLTGLFIVSVDADFQKLDDLRRVQRCRGNDRSEGHRLVRRCADGQRLRIVEELVGCGLELLGKLRVLELCCHQRNHHLHLFAKLLAIGTLLLAVIVENLLGQGFIVEADRQILEVQLFCQTQNCETGSVLVCIGLAHVFLRLLDGFEESQIISAGLPVMLILPSSAA